MDRRDFLTGGTGAAVLASLAAEAFAQSKSPPPQKNWDWDSGQVRHGFARAVGMVGAELRAHLARAPSEDKNDHAIQPNST
jgi:hypothetical protein